MIGVKINYNGRLPAYWFQVRLPIWSHTRTIGVLRIIEVSCWKLSQTYTKPKDQFEFQKLLATFLQIDKQTCSVSNYSKHKATIKLDRKIQQQNTVYFTKKLYLMKIINFKKKSPLFSIRISPWQKIKKYKSFYTIFFICRSPLKNRLK